MTGRGTNCLMPRLDDRVIEALQRHPSVRSVRLAGSRAAGRAHRGSDWDFLVESGDFTRVANDLVDLCRPLEPIAQQWDPLSARYCWLLMLRGPVKVDLIFPDVPHDPEPPWTPTAANLGAIDQHFWDWTLWLNGKQSAGKTDLVSAELDKLFAHILGPLGVAQRPSSIFDAVAAYQDARAEAEERFGCRVPRDLEAEVISVVA
jgi:predicted nucleotidyltransferase